VKKVFVFVSMILMMFVVQINDAKAASNFAYTDGWFDRNPKSYTIVSGSQMLFDNVIDSSAYILNGSKKIEVKLNDSIEIEMIAFFVDGTPRDGSILNIDLYKGDQIVYTIKRDSKDVSDGYIYLDLPIKIDRFVMRTTNGLYGWGIKEIEIFENLSKEPVSNLKANAGYDTADLTFSMPEDAEYASVYVDGISVGNSTDGKYKVTNLASEKDYEISVFAVYEKGISPAQTVKIRTTALPDIDKKLIEVKNITETSATVLFKVGEMQARPKKIDIFSDENRTKKVDTLNISDQSSVSSKLSNLKYETDYKFYIQYTFAGDVVRNTDISFTTESPNREVSNLSASATATDVSLQWKMPDYNKLDFARIYREKKDVGMLARMFSFMASDKYEPLFETNGTTFKDLTVKADTDYKYKVTTVDKSGNETDGKTVSVKTKKMAVTGGGTEIDENGDYVITWTSPTTGKIKVLVGGVQYAIVPASDKRIVIPKAKMKFDLFGKPDVKLVPIDEDGNEGEITSPGTGGTGGGGGLGEIVGGGEVGDVLNPENVLDGGVKLLGVVGLFVLLGLAFRVVPKLVTMIRNAFSKSNGSVSSGRRIQE